MTIRLSTLYNGFALSTSLIGTNIGLWYGIDAARANKCSHPNMTPQEKIGEHICFGIVLGSTALLGTIIGGAYGALSPIAVPCSMYIYYTRNMRKPHTGSQEPQELQELQER